MFFNKEQIKSCVDLRSLIPLIEEGFVRFSQGKAVIPPYGRLQFEEPRGEVHIKYGYVIGQDHYVIKVASNFYDNPLQGIPSGQGLMIIFSRTTGEVKAILHDEGYLTDVRTAIAGAVAVKYLAPKNIFCVGMIGTGTQAYHQLLALKHVVDCKRVLLWGRNVKNVQKFIHLPEFVDYDMKFEKDLQQLAQGCNLIITTTPSPLPLLMSHHIQPGTHITAVGADDKGKQELDVKLFKKADIVAVDSRFQCSSVGDSSFAKKSGDLDAAKVHELGEIILNPLLGRTFEKQITIADLTGIAVQDIQIANAVFTKLQGNI